MIRIQPITCNDIACVSALAADCFIDDPFFLQLSSNKKKRLNLLTAIYKTTIQICIDYGYAYGIKKEGNFISFILYFNYKELKEYHPKEYDYIFRSSGNAKIKTLISKEVKEIDKIINNHAEYLYLLAIGVKQEDRRKGYASKLIKTIQQVYSNYNLFTDASNKSSVNLCKKLGFDLLKETGGCILLRYLTSGKKQATITEYSTVWLAVPHSLKVENLDINIINEEVTKIKYETVSGNDPYFKYSLCANTKARILQINYADLLKYQRYINITYFDEIQLEYGGKIILLYVTRCVSFPGLKNDPYHVDSCKKLKEWNLIPDVYTSIPIQYADIATFHIQEKRSFLINRMMKSLEHRTLFEAGNPVRELDNNNFKDRINRYYLGTIRLQIIRGRDVAFCPDANENSPEREPVNIEMIVSVDKDTKCGVLHLIVLSCGLPVSRYLDSFSRNHVNVVTHNKAINLYRYLKEKYKIEKKGAAKHFLTIMEERDEIMKKNKDLLASVLFCEALFEEGVSLSKVIDKNIMDILSDQNGIAQYNYASVYVFKNVLIQMSKSFQTGLYDRIVKESITLFYIELILFELAAIGIANDWIIQYLTHIDAQFHPGKVLKDINQMFSKHIKSIEFWNIQLNYPSSKRSVDDIRRYFNMAEEKTIFRRNQRELLTIYDMRSDIVDKSESKFISIIMLVFTVISVANVVFSNVKNQSEILLTPFIAILVLFIYRKYLFKNVLSKDNFVKKMFKRTSNER